MGIWLPDARSRRDWLFRIPAGCIPIGDGARRLELPELAMKPDDRVALVGPNGSGKTTLLRHILPRLNLPPDRVLYMPQEISAEQARDILRQVRTLAPPGLGRLMNVVSRLGSQPDRLLQTEQPSPGEVRKLLLALGVAQAAHLVVMDEPTNHLDLPSIECLEEALRDCPGGLLLVSHDLVFLNRLARTRWDILTSADAGGGSELRIASIPDRSRG